MSCFHPFWLENAGWRGAGAVFWEGEAGEKPAAGEKLAAGEKPAVGEEEGKPVVGEVEGKEFGCSFLISSSIETAST